MKNPIDHEAQGIDLQALQAASLLFEAEVARIDALFERMAQALRVVLRVAPAQRSPAWEEPLALLADELHAMRSEIDLLGASCDKLAAQAWDAVMRLLAAHRAEPSDATRWLLDRASTAFERLVRASDALVATRNGTLRCILSTQELLGLPGPQPEAADAAETRAARLSQSVLARFRLGGTGGL